MIRAFQRVLKSRRGKLAAAFLIALAIAGGAAAYYLSTGSGTGSASVGTLNPATISAPSSTTTTSVTISWTQQASMVPSSQNSSITYTVERELNAGSFVSAAGTCSGSLGYNTASCTDTIPSSPTSGTYTYRVIAHFGSSWTAVSNTPSVTANLDMAAPTTTISFPGSGFHSASNYNAGCSPTGICGTANDATGVSMVRVSVRQSSSGKYWDGSGFDNASETFTNATLASPGATSTNWNLALPLPSDGAYTIHVQAKDTLGNDSAPSNTSSGTFSIDTTAPTTTDNTGTLGSGWFKTNQTVTLTPSDGSGSGVAATYYTSGSPTASTPTTGSSQGTSVALNGDGIWQVKYFSVDNVGNAESVKTAGTAIHIDETAPNAGAVLTSGAFVSGGGTTYVKNGQALTDTTTSDPTVNGASSGVASVQYLVLLEQLQRHNPDEQPRQLDVDWQQQHRQQLLGQLDEPAIRRHLFADRRRDRQRNQPRLHRAQDGRSRQHQAGGLARARRQPDRRIPRQRFRAQALLQGQRERLVQANRHGHRTAAPAPPPRPSPARPTSPTPTRP